MKKFSMALMAASMLTVPMFAEDSTPAAEATAAAPVPAATENKVSPWEQFPEVVGEYNGKKVTREDLAEYVANMQIPIPADMFNNPDQLAMIAPQIVDQMIMEQLLLDAAAEKGFVPNVERVKKYFNEAIEQLTPEQKEAQLEMIKADTEDPEMTIEKYVDMMAAKAEIQKSFAIQEYLDSLDFGEATEEEVNQQYDEIKKQYEAAKSNLLDASHILYTPEDETPEADAAAKAKAEEAIKRINAGEKFEDIAHAESNCPSGKAANGELGVFDPQAMIPEFSEAVKAAEEGAVVGPVKTQFGYHVIRRNALPAEPQISRDDLKKRLDGQKMQENMRKMLQELREKAQLKVFIVPPVNDFQMVTPPAQETPAAPAETTN